MSTAMGPSACRKFAAGDEASALKLVRKLAANPENFIAEIQK
jgi:hypothetical protein